MDGINFNRTDKKKTYIMLEETIKDLEETINDIELIYKTVQKLPYSERRDTILLMLAVLTNKVTKNHERTKNPVK